MEKPSAPLNDDFIDVFTLAKKVLYPFRLLFNNVKITSFFIIGAVFIAIALKFTLTPRYASNFIVSPNDKKDLYFINMLLDLSNLVADNDEKGLAKELKLEEKDAVAIKKLKLDPIRASGKNGDSLAAIVITMHLTDPEKSGLVQKHILEYLENNEHYQKSKKLRNQAINDIKQRIKEDINKIDSVQNLVVGTLKPPVASSGGLVYNLPADPFKAYEVNLERRKEMISISYQEANSTSFELVKGYVINYKSVWPKLSILILVLVPSSLLLCILFLHRRNRLNHDT